MKTDDLIRALAADTAPERPLAPLMVLALVPALLVGMAGLWLVMGFRSDLWAAAFDPVAQMRWVLTGALALVSMRLGLVLARPEGRGVVRFWPLLLVALAALAVLLWAYVTTPPEARSMATYGKTQWACLVGIPLLSVLPVAAVMWALRRGATTAPALAGAVAGLIGSGGGAAVYAMHCIEDSPLFYVTWYGLAIVGVTVVASVIGARVLRW